MAAPAAQIVGEGLGGRVASRGILAQRLQADCLEVARQVRDQDSGSGRVRLEDLVA